MPSDGKEVVTVVISVLIIYIYPTQIHGVFKEGQVNRATAATNCNAHSSRSHSVLIITVAR